MPSQKLPHAEADSITPSRLSRQRHALTLMVATGALAASAGLNLIDDPRPLDVQLSLAMREARDTLGHWQGQLSRGLQVSLRAVADGRELPPADPAVLAQADAASRPAASR